MQQIESAGERSAVERFMLSITSPFSDAIFRVFIGYASLALFARLAPQAGWSLIEFLLLALFLIRLIPAVLRRMLPVPGSVSLVWAKQRQLAKRYDSYQWRKLFWLGVGLAAYTLVSGQFLPSRIVITVFCLLSGVLGIARWRILASRIDSTGVSAKQARVSA